MTLVFQKGDLVEKFAGDYTGPGVVVQVIRELPVRVIVAHKIEGGTGRFLHIYNPGQLRRRPARPDEEE